MIADVIQQLGAPILLGVVLTAAATIILVPISLRLAGLSGQQIVDTINLTTQFLVNIVKEFRAQNASRE